MPEIKAGDIVKVKSMSCGNTYSTYRNYFTENNITELLPDWKRGSGQLNVICTVLHVGNHHFDDKKIALVIHGSTSMLVNIQSLELVSSS